MPDTSLSHEVDCPHCGAGNQNAGGLCWMCRQKIHGEEEIITAEVIAPPKFVPQTFSFSLASIFAIMSLVAVGFGLAQIEPGMGILFAFVSFPAVIITFVRTRAEQRTKGRQVGWGERILTFVLSAAAVFAALAIAQFALVIALVAICLLILAGANASGNM